ncbi:transmembrane 7 superfamily member 3-like [Saccoglossus kowalevskii]|uniref:Transmembrane 7 superfamily member 3-like n=1 Tax=Saccoglossus kowalevskii TaxID=10224 RepID=A0ABM0MP03_SACKO|nr:PREDICTED: transmembrane 7 superfamily member 3-like [Saccoglossus kowalevskii]
MCRMDISVYTFMAFLIISCLHVSCNELHRLENHTVHMQVGSFKDIVIPKKARLEFVLENITDFSNTVAVFQIHTQYQNLSASSVLTPTLDFAMNGSDVGLITELHEEQNMSVWYVNSTYNETIRAQAMALLYKDTDPIPGACNFEGNLLNDPNIHVHYNIYETVLQFAPANIGWPRDDAQPSCDTTRSPRLRLMYDVYQYFLPEHKLDEEYMFDGLQKMTTVDRIRKHGAKIATLDQSKKTNFTVSSFRGQGVVFNVIVRDPIELTSAAYIPTTSYACSFTARVDSCYVAADPTLLVIVTVFGIVGLFICFVGHRYFKTEMFIFGFLTFALVFFIIFAAATDWSHLVRLILTMVCALLGGCLLLLYWWRFGSVVFCVLIVGMDLGYLFASLVFFTPFGNLSVWQSNVNYGLAFTCLLLLLPVILIYFTKQLNIIACCFVGSYLCVSGISCYLYSSLGYIVVNPLKRILMPDFDTAYTSVPFQQNDYILVGVWVVLATAGMILQFCRERRIGFPAWPYKEWKRKRQHDQLDREVFNRHLQQGTSDEKKPLLGRHVHDVTNEVA